MKKSVIYPTLLVSNKLRASDDASIDDVYQTLCILMVMMSNVAYKGLLKCGNDYVRYQKLELSKNSLDFVDPFDRGWLGTAINPDQPVVFLDTDGKGWLEMDGAKNGAGGPINYTESSLVEQIALSLSSCGLENSSIGVITPFRSQVSFIATRS